MCFVSEGAISAVQLRILGGFAKMYPEGNAMPGMFASGKLPSLLANVGLRANSDCPCTTIPKSDSV